MFFVGQGDTPGDHKRTLYRKYIFGTERTVYKKGTPGPTGLSVTSKACHIPVEGHEVT